VSDTRAARAASAPPRSSGTVAETESLGESLAPLLAPGDVIGLEGPLGSGKTRFVTGLARGLGVGARVRSPSFTLVNEYPGSLTLFHLDFYRLAGGEDVALGLDEMLDRGALAVEWGDRLPDAYRAGALRLEFEITGENTRTITASAAAGRGLELLARWRGVEGAP
jgi:tRNA threonylcarbamoyladenosine biosynthesis protein TsaE